MGFHPGTPNLAHFPSPFPLAFLLTFCVRTQLSFPSLFPHPLSRTFPLVLCLRLSSLFGGNCPREQSFLLIYVAVMVPLRMGFSMEAQVGGAISLSFLATFAHFLLAHFAHFLLNICPLFFSHCTIHLLLTSFAHLLLILPLIFC